MRRREFLRLVGGTLSVLPVGAWAQQAARLPIVGVLTPHLLDPGFPGFFEELRELGYEDGRNVRLMIRSADAKLQLLPQLATELVNTKVDIIVAINTPGSRAAINATKEIPIVMGIVGDPVATGFVSNLARPGGNVTGVSNMSGELASKRLQILKEAVPAIRRIGVVFNSEDPITAPQVRDTERAAQQLPIEVSFFPVRTPATLPSAFKEMTDKRVDGVLWLAGQSTSFMKGTIDLAIRHRLPTMVILAQDVRAGGLISYYPDHRELFRRVAIYVDKILKGARPGDLPVEQPTNIQLVINLKTARALGVDIPPSLLARADEVIE
jgi:putative tryptophan/tyrosine transport system substrate-binding protein